MKMLRLLNRLLGRHENRLPPFDFARNKYHVKKKWPPNFRALTEKQQFRFERKFKRRVKLKSMRPVWDKWIRVAQWSMISFIVVYGVLFHDFRKDPMNPRPGEQPFEGLRQRMWRILGGFYTHTDEIMGETARRPGRRVEEATVVNNERTSMSVPKKDEDEEDAAKIELGLGNVEAPSSRV